MAEETVIKKKRERKIPPFFSIKFEGKEKKLYSYWHNIGYTEEQELNASLVITPFSEYVPIEYITRLRQPRYFHVLDDNDIKAKLPAHLYTPENIKIMKKRWDNITSTMISRMCAPLSLENAKREIGDYLHSEYPIGIFNNGWNTNRSHYTIEAFTGNSHQINRFYGAGYAGIVGTMMVCMSRINNLIPIIVAVTPRKNLVYQKLHMLLHGEIDLTKCILLIDRELDSPSIFPEPKWRTNVWMKHLLPWIKTLDIEAVKVPNSYIREMCFLPDLRSRVTTLEERRKEKEEIVKSFVEKLAVRCGAAPTTGGIINSVMSDTIDYGTYNISVDPAEEEEEEIEYDDIWEPESESEFN